MSGLVNAHLQLHSQDQGITLSSLLPFARTKFTTDPRDEIFAFMNLLSVVPPSLQVSNSEDPNTTYVRIAQLRVRGDVSLELLAECEFLSHSQPEWSAASLASWALTGHETDYAKLYPEVCHQMFLVMSFLFGGRLLTSSFEIVDDTLLLEALIWDDIVFLDPLLSITQIVPSLYRAAVSAAWWLTGSC